MANEQETIIIITVVCCCTSVTLFLIRACFLSKCTNLSICCGLVDVKRDIDHEAKVVDMPVIQVPIPMLGSNVKRSASIPAIVVKKNKGDTQEDVDSVV